MRGEGWQFRHAHPDRAEAVAVAARIPVATYGAVEVRELAGVDLRRPVAHFGEA